MLFEADSQLSPCHREVWIPGRGKPPDIRQGLMKAIHLVGYRHCDYHKET